MTSRVALITGSFGSVGRSHGRHAFPASDGGRFVTGQAIGSGAGR